jgi:hypothetical protein
MDRAFGPNEWFGVVVVAGDEAVDVVDQFGHAGERRVVERLALQDREPALTARNGPIQP